MSRERGEALDPLEAFRRERPGPAARERNWEALERRLAGEAGRAREVEARERRAARRAPREREDERDDEREDERRGTDVRTVALAIGMTLAIAAAVLLVIGGIGRGLQAARQQVEPGMQAVDEPALAPPRQAVSRRPGPATGIAVEREPTPTPATPPSPLPQPHARDGSTPTRPPTPTPAASPGPQGGPVASPEALAEQTRLLARARQALAEHEPTEALRLLEQLGERFPAGALDHERRAYEAIARCRLDPPASDAAARFLADHPASPHAPRVRAACDAPTAATPPRE